MTTGSKALRLLLRAGAAGLALTLVCYSPQAALPPQNLELVQILPSADVALPAMSKILGGDDQATRTLESARLVYRHFIYDTIGHSREAIPVKLAPLFESNIGECDTAARLFAEVGAAGGGQKFRQFDLIAVLDKTIEGRSQPLRWLHGHSIAAMEGPAGSIALDPTFGLLLVSSAPKFTAEILQRQEYRLYRLYDAPPDYDGIWPGMAIALLRQMTNADSDAAFAGRPLRAVSAAIALTEEVTTIGVVDDSSADIARRYGSWLDHLGWYYTPGSHVWNFETSDGGNYTFMFRFAPGAQKTLAADDFVPQVRIATTGTAALVAPAMPDVSLEGNGLDLRVRVQPGKFGISVSTDAPGARKIDAIFVLRETGPKAPDDAAQAPEVAKAGGPT